MAPDMLQVMELVYVFAVEDADADSWSAEVAVAASKPSEAVRRIRSAGLHKKQIRNEARPVRVIGLDELPELGASSGGIVRRRLNDAGWTPWSAVPKGASLNWRVSGDAVVETNGRGHG